MQRNVPAEKARASAVIVPAASAPRPRSPTTNAIAPSGIISEKPRFTRCAVARGTPADLGEREQAATTIRYRADGREVVVETTTPVRTLHELTGEALARGEELEGLEVTRPSLEDVYLELTAEAEAERASAEAEAAETSEAAK